MASEWKLVISGSVKLSRLDFEFIINVATNVSMLAESKYGFYTEMSQNSVDDDSSSNLSSDAFHNRWSFSWLNTLCELKWLIWHFESQQSISQSLN